MELPKHLKDYIHSLTDLEFETYFYNECQNTSAARNSGERYAMNQRVIAIQKERGQKAAGGEHYV